MEGLRILKFQVQSANKMFLLLLNFREQRKSERLPFLFLKGELQRQNKLLSAERPFGVLQNETKIVKIRQGVLEIFNFKDLDLDSFTRKKRLKTENVVF